MNAFDLIYSAQTRAQAMEKLAHDRLLQLIDLRNLCREALANIRDKAHNAMKCECGPEDGRCDWCNDLMDRLEEATET